MMRYRDRREAGKHLADALRSALPAMPPQDAIVLGVPRGGVVVASEVARRLGLPLDVALARKLGAPFNPELAIGAIAEGGAVWVNRSIADRLGVDETWLDDVIARETRELERRAARYRAAEPPHLAGRVLIVVDDGVATGATLAAVLRALQAAAPAQLICAVPVAPPDAVGMLAQHCDLVVCPSQPRHFEAVGAWYADFTQTTDDEVVALLDRAQRPHVGEEGSG